MPTLEIVRTLFEYNYSLYQRVWDSIMHVTEEQFVQEIPYSLGSLRNQIVHVAGVDGRWVRGLKELPNPRDFTPAPRDYPTRADARALWETTSEEVQRYVASLDETRLMQPVAGLDEPAWQILMQLVNHGTDHRAQMLRILHDFGAPTFDQDFIIYLWDRE